MDTSSCFCVVAAVLSIFTVLWTLRDRCGSGYWMAACGALSGALSWALGSGLYLNVPPALCGTALLTCSFILILVTERRVELLPVERRAVLVTGETHTHSVEGLIL